MRLVVSDASAVVEFLLRTRRGESFERVVSDAEADLHVPALCDVEVASALRRLWMSKALSTERRDQAMSDYVDLPLARHGHLALLPRILGLASTLSAYDATYAALAEALDADLMTADDRMARALSAHTELRLV